MFYGHSYDGSFVFWGESRVLSREKQAPGCQQWLWGFPQLPILQFLSCHSGQDRHTDDAQYLPDNVWKKYPVLPEKDPDAVPLQAEPAWSCASIPSAEMDAGGGD